MSDEARQPVQLFGFKAKALPRTDGNWDLLVVVVFPPPLSATEETHETMHGPFTSRADALEHGYVLYRRIREYVRSKIDAAGISHGPFLTVDARPSRRGQA